MTQKWDDIKHKIEKFATTAVDKASEITKDAAEKAEQLTKQGKIKLDIFGLVKSKDKEYTKLGKLIFAQIDSEKFSYLKDDKEAFKLIEQIEKINSDIKIEEEKLNSLKKHNNNEEQNNEQLE